VLPATRRRFIPATLVLTGALMAALVGTAVPAQATSVATVAAVTPTAVTAVAKPVAVVRPTAAQIRAAYVVKVRAKAVRVARAQVGDRYRAGAAGPSAFDCSGLAMYVAKHSYGRSLPHYSKAQYRVTKRVTRANLRPGDLVFFFKRGAHHVGVYIGHGKMVGAANPRKGVRIDSVFSGWYGARYTGAGRLV
jgi:cell wall-associated NlpC family hydrolase